MRAAPPDRRQLPDHFAAGDSRWPAFDGNAIVGAVAAGRSRSLPYRRGRGPPRNAKGPDASNVRPPPKSAATAERLANRQPALVGGPPLVVSPPRRNRRA